MANNKVMYMYITINNVLNCRRYVQVHGAFASV